MRRIEEQAEEIGGLRNEVEHLRAQLAEAASPNGQAEAQNGTASWPERHRWWQRLVWG